MTETSTDERSILRGGAQEWWFYAEKTVRQPKKRGGGFNAKRHTEHERTNRKRGSRRDPSERKYAPKPGRGHESRQRPLEKSHRSNDKG